MSDVFDAGGGRQEGAAAAWLRDWAIGLREPEAAEAFVAVGLALARPGDDELMTFSGMAETLELILRRQEEGAEEGEEDVRYERRRASPWVEPRLQDERVRRLAPAPAWVEAWEDARSRFGTRPRPWLALEVADDTDLRWLRRTLATPRWGESGIAGSAVHWHRPTRSTWRFPLRVGFLPDAESRGLRDRLVAGFEGSSWQGDLIRPVTLGSTAVSCDLLVVPGDPWDVPTRLLELTELRAGAVVVHADEVSPGLGVQRHVLDKISDIADAWAVGVVVGANTSRWIVDVVQNLSHALPLAHALDYVAANDFVLAVDEDVMLRETIDERALRVADSLRLAVDDVSAGEGDIDFGDGAGAVPRPRQWRLARELERIARESRFDSERGGATDVRLAEADADALLDSASGARHIQARITDHARGEVANAIERDSTYDIAVRIAAPAAGWLVAPRAFPEEGLRPDVPHRLTVVLSEPTLLERPEVRHIDLPPAGPSTLAAFTLATRPDTDELDARVIVLSGNRILQTALIRQPVGEISEGGVGAAPELAIAPAIDDLDDRRTFAAAFVVNRNVDGVSRATSVVGDLAGQIRLDSATVTSAVEQIASHLTEIVEAPEDFTTLSDAGSVGLLGKLAFHGANLHAALVHDAPGLSDVLAGRPRGLQVVAAKPDAYFPLEFAYAFPKPTRDAGLCPRATEVLADPDPHRRCPGPHTADVVCPLGFWGLRHVIERHAYQPADAVSADFVVHSSPRRRDGVIHLSAALFAASRRVNRVVPGGIDAVLDALRAASALQSQVDEWAAWKSAVATAPGPSLLLLMPHTVYDDHFSVYGLEIGEASVEVAFEAAVPADAPAVVVLLGCETARAGAVSYELFPAQFRLAGAKVVIATLTEVLGRHAAPIAVRLVSEVYDQTAGDDRGIGDVLLAARRHLLAAGLLPVLAVVAFGDADWIIGS